MNKMDYIDVFKQDKLFINDHEYDRKSFYDIAKDLNLEIKEHPFNNSLHTIEIMKDVTINSIVCRMVMIEAADDKIMDVIMYPYYRGAIIASCSINYEPDIYDTPAGTMCDYVMDETHKISLGPDGCVLYMWD